VRADHEEELDEIEEKRAAINARFAEVRNAAQADYDAVVEPARQEYQAVLAKAEADRQAALEEVRPEIEAMEQQLVNEAEALLATMGDELNDAVPDPEQYDWPGPAEGGNPDIEKIFGNVAGLLLAEVTGRRPRGEDCAKLIGACDAVPLHAFDEGAGAWSAPVKIGTNPLRPRRPRFRSGGNRQCIESSALSVPV
jgi:hypothetical protein